MSSKTLDNKNVAEFFAVATEFCAFLTKTEKFNTFQFVDKSLKILSLLYLKASMLSEIEIESDGYIERYVSEDAYNAIHTKVCEKLGEYESYFDITEPHGYATGETVNVSTSECFADIFQDVMNFVEQFRDFEDEEREIALGECVESFKNFWGIRASMLIAELHLVRYGSGIAEQVD